tara:strand:+ start:414 stop:806 length:393 start_codon:yes stop_codon:yes gene_type:complete
MSEIKISDVQERWKVSRPTVMKAIKSGKLSGTKNDSGRWQFTIDEVVRWRGEPKSQDWVSINNLPAPTPPDQNELVEALKKQIEQLSDQVQVKDNQIEKLQDQMRDQTKLLEHQAERQAKTWSQRLFGGE